MALALILFGPSSIAIPNLGESIVVVYFKNKKFQ